MLESRPPLYIWFHAPPKVGRGAFNWVASNWGNTVSYCCHQDFAEERKRIGWDAGDYGAAHVRLVSDDSRANAQTARELLLGERDSIHLFAGFGQPIRRRLRQYLLDAPSPRAAVFSERPGVYGPSAQRLLKRVLYPLRHGRYGRQFRYGVSAYLPLGSAGVDRALKDGWPAENVFPFMYCPDLPPLCRTPTQGDCILRMLYIGRFASHTKGVDVLIDAVNALPTGP